MKSLRAVPGGKPHSSHIPVHVRSISTSVQLNQRLLLIFWDRTVTRNKQIDALNSVHNEKSKNSGQRFFNLSDDSCQPLMYDPI